MIEILKYFIDLMLNFINKLFEFEIELTPGNNVSVAVLAISFSAVVIIIYIIFRALGFIKGDDQ